jgi:hypothetical protein
MPTDARRGKTGSGIWLHGTPPDQFVRAPKATDGCVVLANPDLERMHQHGAGAHHAGGDRPDALQWVATAGAAAPRAAL